MDMTKHSSDQEAYKYVIGHLEHGNASKPRRNHDLRPEWTTSISHAD